MRATGLLMAVVIAACVASCGTNRDDMTGAYGKSTKLSTEDDSIFKIAVLQHGGLDLKPLKVSHQVVAGTNYCFKCVARNKKKVEVTVFEPLPGQGDARLVSISGREYK